MPNINEKALFIKLDNYKKTLEQLNMLKSKLEEANAVFNKIVELKKEEDAEISLWQSGLAEVEKKIDYVEKTLFEPNGQ
jgi:hypothetical protein